MTQASTQVPAPATRPRDIDVTAVVVTRGATEYLQRTLAALAAQTRRPQRVLLVDADGDDAGVDELARLIAETSPGAGRPDRPELVVVPGARTFGHAVRGALAGAAPASDRSWIWLLHDDSAPAPDALAQLLHAVEVAPSVGVAGCKQHSWSDPVRVLEVGVSTSRFGRRMTGLDEPEVDQGQHDSREDVLGVGTAGALVRRDVWDELGGTDPALGPYGDGLDLSRRARLAGHRVVVVPQAVVRHAQASLARPTAGAVLNRPGWDARRSVQARRQAYLHSQLTGVPAALVPVVAVLAVASSVVRALGRFLLKEPHLVVAELTAPWAVLARPGRVLRARRAATRTRRTDRRSLRPLQVTWREVVRLERDRRMTTAERRRTRSAPSELELRELAALRTRRRGMLAVVLLLATVVTAVVLGPLVTRVLGGARLTGGSLAFGDADRSGLWSTIMAGWVPGGFGSPGPVDPLLAALVPLTLLAGDLGRATAVVLLGGIVLAAAGAWFAAGAATRSVALRAWATLVWVAAPALLAGLTQARLGGVLVHAMLPWAVLGVARAVGHARVDAVESGLVGAQRATVVPDGSGRPGRSSRADVPAQTVRRTADASLAAAAGAGLALAVVVAAAPVLLPAGLVSLLVVAVTAPRRRRLVWVALPALVLQLPTLLDAAAGWSAGAWRTLLADPGVPVPGQAAPAWQQLLGWPVTPWIDLPGRLGWSLPVDGAAGAVPFALLAATGVVGLVALLALAAPGGRGRAARIGWLVAACGVGAGVLAAATHVAVAPDGTTATAVPAWTGGPASLVLAGLLTAALAGASGLRATMARHSFGWRQLVAGVLTALAVLGPAFLLGAWVRDVRSATEPWEGALALRAVDVPVVPAVGRQMQRSPDAVRVLALEVGEDDDVRVTLLRQDGVQLTELSRSVAGRDLVGGFGAPVPAEPDPAEAVLADVAARIVSGASARTAVDLARLGVGAVLVPPDPSVGAQTMLVARLDSTPGMERVTQTESGVIWRVAAGELGTTTAWARLVDSAGGTGGVLLAPVAAQGRGVDTEIPAGQDHRLLVLAERSGPGWRAWLDGEPLRAVRTGWQQAFEVGPQGGRLEVTHAPANRTPWLVLQGLTLLVTVLLALPVRRRRGDRR